jgi:drug/metabolite transporter (DMT)-like permease
MRPADRILLLALGCVWGSSFLWTELGLRGFSPVQVVLGRLTVGGIVLLLAVRIVGVRLPRSPGMWGHLAVMAVIANIVPYFLFSWGQEEIPSGLAGVLNASTPLFTLVVASMALREERLGVFKIVGLLIGFGGVVLVVGPWEVDSAAGPLVRQLACVAAAACYAVGFVYTRRFLTGRGVGPMALAAAQISLAAAILWLLTPFVGRGAPTWSVAPVAGVVILGLGGTGLAYLLFFKLVGAIGATATSLVTYVIPVVAVILGVVVLGEPLRWNLFAGGAVVVLGVGVVEGRIGVAKGVDVPATGRPAVPPAAGTRGGRDVR